VTEKYKPFGGGVGSLLEGRQGYEEEGEEPDYVEVEPVVEGQLEGDHQGG
jgi:hypothetical protein